MWPICFIDHRKKFCTFGEKVLYLQVVYTYVYGCNVYYTKEE